ncbi:hypothetical protein HWC99_gp10 [Flavobacterium phage vB_FspS_tant8-1]|uniref:Uncharacterized protein n=1 Tax=Flavobacterium phage vB_FspS_tant8-1 TaxID=2686278 RepID=A0A6B9LNM3_9CAUD|nr:hypothetical protein HWC99_gp10 [Flavobacterium phage vB_FspS_tant8-1]QHB40941.1 hypothetical protein tant81_gp010 [Flavobacterium phage vB_FspS_tant8-1]
MNQKTFSGKKNKNCFENKIKIVFLKRGKFKNIANK